ncbi:hypothetical protein [Treponema sp.]|uniref:hypothetical protein n=1 Tax=Treponema sp. TaxID=166 RepID=UPI0025D92F69|nr:hypothetical protein [Treponema sp.]MCR5217691.1 hypothetical protein [Treponema sp.]
MKRFSCFSFVLISSVFLTLSCDIGLGASVDTQPPLLEVNNPEPSQVCSGDILVSGTMSDDKGVARVDITLKNTDTNETIGQTFHAELLDSEKWQLNLYTGSSLSSQEGDMILPDGKYELTATAYDSSGHSYKRDRAFTVDSTPPVFVISKPGTLNISSPDPFGRTIKISGKISDDNSVKTMKVRLYKEDGTEIQLAKNEFTGFDTADTAVTIAKYYESEAVAAAKGESDLYQNYKNIYGVKGDSTFDTEQKYYAFVTVTDTAGNESQTTYIESYLKEELTALGESLEMYEIKNLLNGSYSGSLSQEKQAAILQILKGEGSYALPNSYLANSEHMLAFSVDSRANPSYALDYSYTPGDSDSFTEILKDQALNIEVTAGLDKAYIKPDTLKVKIYEIPSTGYVDDSAEPVVTIESQNIYIGSSDNHITSETAMTTSAKYRVRISEFGTSLIAGKSYCVYVEGQDQDNNEFIAADGKNYGFKIQTTASAPNLSFNVKNGEYKKAADFAAASSKAGVSFTVSDETGAAMKFTLLQKVFDGIKEESEIAFEEGSYTVIKDELQLEEGPGPHQVDVDLVIPAEKLAVLKNYTIALRAVAENDGNSTSRTYFFYADNAPPQISLTNSELAGWDGQRNLIITEETASISKENGEYKYKVQGTWSDEEGSGTKTVHYAVKTASMSEYSQWLHLDSLEAPQVKNLTYWSKTFPVEHGEGKDIKIKYYAEDQSGNKSQVYEFTNVIFDFSLPSVSVKENTSPLSAYCKKGDAAKLELTASDSNQLASVEVTLLKKASASDKNPVEINPADYGITVTKEETLADGTKESPVTIQFATDGGKTGQKNHDGIYVVQVRAEDIAGRQSSLYTAETIVDGTLPVLKDNIIYAGSEVWQQEKYFNDTRLNISGSYNEESLDTVYYYVKASDSNEAAPADLSKKYTGETSSLENGSFKFSSVEFKTNHIEGSLVKPNVIYIQAKDKAGNLSAVSSFEINIDTSAPEVSGLYYQVGSSQILDAGGTVYVNGTEAVTLYGLYSDKESGVDELALNAAGTKIWYSEESLTSSDDVENLTWKSYGDLESKELIRSWKARFTPLQASALSLEAKNIAGTSRNLNLFPLALDTSNPVINSSELYIISDSSEEAAYTDDSSLRNKYYINPDNKTFAFKGTVTDNYGLDSVALTITSGSSTITKLQNFSTASGNYEFTDLDMSSWTENASATIRVSDKAGNFTQKNISIIMDRRGPEAYHQIDANGEDLYLRLGNKGYDELTSSATNSGRKNGSQVFVNSSQIEVRGKITDGSDGSGVKKISYMVFDKPVEIAGTSTEPVLSGDKYQIKDTDSLRDYVITNARASFKTGAEESARVFYSVLDGEQAFEGEKDTESSTLLSQTAAGVKDGKNLYRYYKTVRTNYHESLSGFDNNVNYLVIAAEDNAGNTSIDYVNTGDQQQYYTVVKKDSTPANISLDESSGGIKYVSVYSDNGSYKYKNGEKLILKGSASDDASGVNELSLRVGSSNLISLTDSRYGKLTVTKSGLTAQWQAEIYASAFASSTGNEVIFGIVTDNAGEGTVNELPLTTVLVDTKAPEVSLDIGEATVVNKKISITGSVSDDNTLPLTSVKSLEYSLKGENWKASSATWTALVPEENPGEGDFAITGNYSFTIKNFDTENLADNSSYMIRVAASDVAGNTGYSEPVEIKINQDSDRPVVTLTNMNIAASGNVSYLKSTTTLYGTVSDDDGNISSIEYSLDRGTTWTALTLSGSSWTISGFNEGSNLLWFRIKDSANTVFTTAASSQPKICDSGSGENKHYVSSEIVALAFNVATESPSVSQIKYSVFNSKESTWSPYSSELRTMGGIYTKFRVSLMAKSAQMIGSAKVVYGGKNYAFTCSDQHYNDVDDHNWISEDIILASKDSFDLKVYDQVPDPMVWEQTLKFSIDNVKPLVKISKPSATVGVSETMRGEVTNESGFKVYYALSRSQDDVPQDQVVTSAGKVRSTKWVELTDTNNGTSWFVYFDDDLDAVDHTDKFAVYLTEKYLGITTKAEIEAALNPYDTVTPVYFWVKVLDDCGNVTEMSQLVNVDPQGERPSLELSYPLDVNGEAPTLGGAIRMTGTAVDNNAAKYVYVQIADGRNSAFTLADLEKIYNFKDSAGSSIYKIGDMRTNTLVTSLAGITEADVSNYGIMVDVKGTGWNQTINTNKELNPSSTGKSVFTLIFHATDEECHRSIPVSQVIEIDAKSPYVDASSLYLVQYDGEGNVSARQPYSDGKNVKGIWYLTGTFKDDDSGISLIQYDGKKVVSSAGQSYTEPSDSNCWFKAVSDTYNGKIIYHYDFSVPMGSKEAGKVGSSKVEFYVVENTDNELPLSLEYNITYDNKAPVFNTDSSNIFVKLNQKIYNQHGFYTFGAIASEDEIETSSGEKLQQSGVERIAFYFTRDLDYSLGEFDAETYPEHVNEKNAKTNDLFDVMVYHSNKEADDISSGNMIINYQGRSDILYQQGLYWKKYSGTVDGTTFSYTGSPDANIHPRGLVKINGTIYLISNVSGTTIQLEENPGDGSADAWFALCNVIDHGSEKNGSEIVYSHGYGYGYYKKSDTDDGDLITETFSKQGTEWIFDASINSKNLPDGPVTLHMVVFDAAGNCSDTPYTLDCVVSNNAPRLAGLLVGTDEDGNGTVDESEFNTNYHTADVSNFDLESAPDTVTYPVQTSEKVRSALTVKGVTEVRPEIVGGNGKISYEYTVYQYDEAQKKWTDQEKCGTVSGKQIASGTTDSIAQLDESIILQVKDFIGTLDAVDDQLISDGKYKKFQFDFGDSTPGKKRADAVSNTATLNVIMDVSLRKNTSAQNWVLPFYWNTANDNSLFENSVKNGHIEYPSDWVRSAGYDVSDGERDGDPKVSGKIKIEGIAHDQTLLSQIRVKFSKAMAAMGTNETVIASYNASGEPSWTAASVLDKGALPAKGWAAEIKKATYGELIQVGLIESLPAGKKSSDEVDYTSQEYGHVVHWILYLDTEKVNGVSVTDVLVETKAADRGKPVWNAGLQQVVYSSNQALVTGSGYSGQVSVSGSGSNMTVNQGDLTGSIRMDIVPYVSSIKTGARNYSGLKANNIRSAEGKYSILANIANNVITVNGFNLAPSAAWIVNEDNLTAASFTNANASSIGFTAGSTNTFTLTNSNITKSGYLEVISNGQRTLNNINYNDAKGSYTYTGTGGKRQTEDYRQMPNREPDFNSSKNVILTDDRYFRFFDMTATQIKNGYYPNMIMDGDDPVFGYIDLNGVNAKDNFNGYVRGCYQAQRTKFNGSTGTFDEIEYLLGAISSDQMAMVRDESGKYIHATVYNYAGASMDVVYNDYAEDHFWDDDSRTDGWAGGTGYQGYGGVYSTDGYNNAIALEKTSFGGSTLIGRYQNIRMAVKGNSGTNTGASIYMAYYDDNTANKDIIFRTFKIGTNRAWRNTNTLNNTQIGTRGRYSNLADNNTSGRITAGSSGSKYLDMAVTSENIVVIVYYDVNDACLKLRYSSGAVDGSTITPDVTWQSAKVDFPAYVGTDVSMAIDSNNGIHIAAFDANDSDLVYMYMPSCDSGTLKQVRVDQAASVGNWTCVRLKDDIPYIAYYNSTEAGSREPVKLAYFTSKDAEGEALAIKTAEEEKLQGVDSDGYTTGVWEYMTVPALTPPQGSDSKFRQVNLDFDSSGHPVLGYLGTTLEFGTYMDE